MPSRANGRKAPLDAVRRGAEQDPGLQQPGDVERREQQRTEVVRGRADRVHDRVLAVQQLAATARRYGGGDGEQQEAGHRRAAGSSMVSSAYPR